MEKQSSGRIDKVRFTTLIDILGIIVRNNIFWAKEEYFYFLDLRMNIKIWKNLYFLGKVIGDHKYGRFYFEELDYDEEIDEEKNSNKILLYLNSTLPKFRPYYKKIISDSDMNAFDFRSRNEFDDQFWFRLYFPAEGLKSNYMNREIHHFIEDFHLNFSRMIITELKIFEELRFYITRRWRVRRGGSGRDALIDETDQFSTLSLVNIFLEKYFYQREPIFILNNDNKFNSGNLIINQFSDKLLEIETEISMRKDHQFFKKIPFIIESIYNDEVSEEIQDYYRNNERANSLLFHYVEQYIDKTSTTSFVLERVFSFRNCLLLYLKNGGFIGVNENILLNISKQIEIFNKIISLYKIHFLHLVSVLKKEKIIIIIDCFKNLLVNNLKLEKSRDKKNFENAEREAVWIKENAEREAVWIKRKEFERKENVKNVKLKKIEKIFSITMISLIFIVSIKIIWHSFSSKREQKDTTINIVTNEKKQ